MRYQRVPLLNAFSFTCIAIQAPAVLQTGTSMQQKWLLVLMCVLTYAFINRFITKVWMQWAAAAGSISLMQYTYTYVYI
jgi:hypothetical protein